jgi:hypothetical protein
MMPMHLGQLLYTSFPHVGLSVMTSPQVPEEIQHSFVEDIAHRYWDIDHQLPSQYRAVFCYQPSLQQTLFGWLLAIESKDFSNVSIPCFIGYYASGALQRSQLNAILVCLANGPLQIPDELQYLGSLDDLELPNDGHYRSAYPGVTVSAEVCDRCYQLLSQQRPIDFFVSHKPDPLQSPLLAPEPMTDASRLVASPDPTSTMPSLPPPDPSEVLPTALKPIPTARAKVALLIGVSDYGPGFAPLPGVRRDLEAIQQVLEDAAIAGFTQVQTLLNPNRQEMAEAIESLFLDRQPDDLVLLYFSGHGLVNEASEVSLTTGISRRDARRRVVRATTIPANFLYEVMQDGPATQQIVILDCSLSEVTPKQQADEVGYKTVQWLLEGTGKTALIASASTQYFSGQKGADLSAYTFYLFEGLATGAADLNDDGAISVYELHQYAKYRVGTATPAMNPVFYGADTGQSTVLARTQTDDVRLRYRREVERYIQQGSIAPVNQIVLNILREDLGLAPTEAAEIQAEVFKPYQDYHYKLQEYARAYVDAREPVTAEFSQAQAELQQFRDTLGLLSTNTTPLESEITRQLGAIAPPTITDPLSFAESPIETELQRPQRLSQPKPKSKGFGWQALAIGLVIVAALSTAALLFLRWQESQERMKQAQHLLEQKDYEACVHQGQSVLQDANLGSQVQPILDRCQAGLKWQNVVQGSTLPGHKGAVWSVAVSADGRLLASGGDDNQVRLWDVETGQLLYTLVGHTAKVWTVAFSRTRPLLASGSEDGQIKLWDVETGNPRITLPAHTGSVWTLAFSPDGRLVSGGEDNAIKVWKADNGEAVNTLIGHQEAVRAIAISPDGQTLVSGSRDRTIRIWDLQDGTQRLMLPGHRDRISTLSITADGQKLVSSSLDKTIKIWNLATGEALKTVTDEEGWVSSLALNPNNRIFALSSGNLIQIRDLETGDILNSLDRQASNVNTLAFTPNGQELVSGNQDSTVQLWLR